MFTFEFTVNGLTHEQADALLKIILLYTESHGAEVGGGFGPTEPEVKDDEQTSIGDTDQNPQ
jgi:hypothetical protein